MLLMFVTLCFEYEFHNRCLLPYALSMNFTTTNYQINIPKNEIRIGTHLIKTHFTVDYVINFKYLGNY